jgi:hypothetical protein
MTNSRVFGAIMALVGIGVFIATWFSWNYGKINWPFDFFFYLLSSLAVIVGAIMSFIGGRPAQQRYIGVRACGIFLVLLGLAVLVLAFAEGTLTQQARAEGKVVAGGFGPVILMIFGILTLVAGIGVVALNKFAIYSAIPISILMILAQGGNLYQGNPISMGFCLGFLIIICFLVYYLVKSRSAG